MIEGSVLQCKQTAVHFEGSLFTLLKRFLFRNLSLGGGPEVCVKMVEQDVMTPLSTFVRQVREKILNK